MTAYLPPHSVKRYLLLARVVTFVFTAPATTPRWLTGRFDSTAVRVAITRWWSRYAMRMASRAGFHQRQSTDYRHAVPLKRCVRNLVMIFRWLKAQRVGV